MNSLAARALHQPRRSGGRAHSTLLPRALLPPAAPHNHCPSPLHLPLTHAGAAAASTAAAPRPARRRRRASSWRARGHARRPRRCCSCRGRQRALAGWHSSPRTTAPAAAALPAPAAAAGCAEAADAGHPRRAEGVWPGAQQQRAAQLPQQQHWRPEPAAAAAAATSVPAPSAAAAARGQCQRGAAAARPAATSRTCRRHSSRQRCCDGTGRR